MQANWTHLRQALSLLALIATLTAAPAAAAVAPQLSDNNIRNKVEATLQRSNAVDFDNIDITVTNGIVTLSGTEDSVLGKRRAARLTETVRGVRSVVNQVTVEPYKTLSKTQLQRDVEAALLQDAATDSYEIEVTALSNGRVQLTGTVDSFQERELAGLVAAGVGGVTAVQNDLEVDYAAIRGAMELEPEIKRALQWDALINAEHINIDAEDGRVRLSGKVGSAAARRRAQNAAWVAGVREVTAENLEVDPSMASARQTTAADPARGYDVEDAVNDALLFDPRVNSFDVEVDATGSVVTLRGTVDNVKAKRAAAQDARDTTGVSSVMNRIKVRSQANLTDTAIAADVREALLRDPYVERYEVDVSVVDGTVYLSGTVDSFFEKAQADDVVATVNGVTTVSNGLVVNATQNPIYDDPYVFDWYVYDYDWYDYEPTYATRSDAELHESIESEMWWSPFVDSDEVTISVDDGVATLTGTVDSWSERRSATENALEGGAVAVDNDLAVNVQ